MFDFVSISTKIIVKKPTYACVGYEISYMNLRWTRMSLQHVLCEAYLLMVETKIDRN